ncbi:MAG: hypothetical protein ACKPHQ_04545 [Dolichospermum sp.]
MTGDSRGGRVITHYLLPITNYPLPITHYQLPITSLNRYDIALSGVMKYISSGQDARTTRVS